MDAGGSRRGAARLGAPTVRLDMAGRRQGAIRPPRTCHGVGVPATAPLALGRPPPGAESSTASGTPTDRGVAVAKSPAEQFREITNTLATLTERVDNLRREADDSRGNRDKVAESLNDLRKEI